MKLTALKKQMRLQRLVAQEEDWAKENAADLLSMIQQMLLIRRFEQRLLELQNMDLVNGPVHSSIGQEGVAVGAIGALRPSDKIAGTHRAHHQYLAKALSYHAPPGYNPLSDGITGKMKEAVRELLAEVMGLSPGCCGGRGGSMHLYGEEIGFSGSNAIVAGGIPIATGVAWAEKFLGTDNVVVCFFGDGALNQGAFHEAINLAALWKAPIVYLVENNLYAVSTTPRNSCSVDELCERAAGYGIAGIQVDGMDPMAVKLAVREVIKEKSQTGLPCLIEAQTYRYLHHGGDARGSAYGYRDKDEEAEWQARDPLELCLRKLSGLGVLDEKKQGQLQEDVERCVEEAVSYCTETSAGNAVVVKEALWPDPGTMYEGLRDETIAERLEFVESHDMECTREVKYVEAIADVTGRWLEKDARVFVLGEEVANLKGGAYGATRGLADRFPGRVLNTPISEAGFCGLACGAAMAGLKPIVEVMFPNFALVAADQLFDQIGQLGHIYGAKVDVPLVARTRVAIGCGYGGQHSMDPVALFSLFPGWRILAPANAFDDIGLFNAAMMSASPTLMVEHHELYNEKGKIPEGPLDYLVQPGKARVVRRGKDVTVIAHSYMVSLVLEAAALIEAEDIEVEVIDLRTLDSAGIDYESIGSSLGRTGALVTVEQAPTSNSIGAKIVAECERRFFDNLDGPAVSVTSADIPIPVSRKLELAALPDVQTIANTVRAVALRQT